MARPPTPEQHRSKRVATYSASAPSIASARWSPVALGCCSISSCKVTRSTWFTWSRKFRAAIRTSDPSKISSAASARLVVGAPVPGGDEVWLEVGVADGADPVDQAHDPTVPAGSGWRVPDSLVPSQGRLAQLEERHVHTVEVVGSRPASPTERPRSGGVRVVLGESLCTRTTLRPGEDSLGLRLPTYVGAASSTYRGTTMCRRPRASARTASAVAGLVLASVTAAGCGPSQERVAVVVPDCSQLISRDGLEVDADMLAGGCTDDGEIVLTNSLYCHDGKPLFWNSYGWWRDRRGCAASCRTRSRQWMPASTAMACSRTRQPRRSHVLDVSGP